MVSWIGGRDMKLGKVHPLTEADIDFVLDVAGGVRAHPEADKRGKPGADYYLGSTLLELKMLEDEGFLKSERQAKLAALFRPYSPERPVIVLDAEKLELGDRQRFNRIVETPIKVGIAKASKQLKQSRSEYPEAKCSVLFVVNNGYTTMSHDVLVQLVVHRTKNDTREIDAVVVAGSYFHSDGFDDCFLWPIDYIPINPENPFLEFDKLKEGWNGLADKFMTDMVTGASGPALEKGPVVDVQFDLDGVTYIRPAPVLGFPSAFYARGRPRMDSTGLSVCPPVATIFPLMSEEVWGAFNKRLNYPSCLLGSFGMWVREQGAAVRAGTSLRPTMLVPITLMSWVNWCSDQGVPETVDAIFAYINQVFTDHVREGLEDVREHDLCKCGDNPYILVVTEVIGQDKANDVSHLALVEPNPNGEFGLTPLVENARIFHEHAITLGVAYALRMGLTSVFWQKNLEYAWI